MHIPAERLVVIEVPDSMDEETQFQAISQLLEKIETEDTLFVDLSGGLRDVAMLLVIAARCMRDLRKVQTRRVIYAELRGGESIVRDRTQLYGLFDFVTAMDQFFSTGTAQKAGELSVERGRKRPGAAHAADPHQPVLGRSGTVPGAEAERRFEPDRSGTERNARRART